MRRLIVIAVIFALFTLASQAQTTSNSQCGQYPVDIVGQCSVVQILPWVAVRNTEQTPGDLAKGIVGEGWKVTFSFSNITLSTMGVTIDLLTSDGTQYIPQGVLFVNDGGSALGQMCTVQFAVNPGGTRTLTLLSAADVPLAGQVTGNPNSNEMDMVARVTYSTSDAATMDQILGQGTVSMINYVRDPTSGQLVSQWSSVTNPRVVSQLTNSAYTNVSVTPVEFWQGNSTVWNVGFAVNNTSSRQQTLTICLIRADGKQFPCNQEVMGPWQSKAWMLDQYFGQQTFSNGNMPLFQGKVVVSSADKVSLFVLQNVGVAGSSAPWWPL
jgi:hypothetical protein